MDMTKEEQALYDQGYRYCRLCGQWCPPVNHHNDCALCAQAQYGD